MCHDSHKDQPGLGDSHKGIDYVLYAVRKADHIFAKALPISLR